MVQSGLKRNKTNSVWLKYAGIVIICAAILITALFLLFRIEMPPAISFQPCADAETVIGGICDEAPVEQVFTATTDSIASVNVMVGTYKRTNRFSLVLELRDEATDALLMACEVDPSRLVDNAYQRVDFSPVSVTPGGQYRLTFRAEGSDAQNTIAFYRTGDGTADAMNYARLGGTAQSYSLAIKVNSHRPTLLVFIGTIAIWMAVVAVAELYVIGIYIIVFTKKFDKMVPVKESASETPTQRIFGVDCLKMIAIISVPSLHFFNYFLLPENNLAIFFFQHCIRWLCFIGPCLFFAISGYLYANKNFSKKYCVSALEAVAVVFIYCFLDALILHEDFAFSNVWYYFINLPGYYWYIQCWFVTLLFVPFINVIIANTTLKQYYGLLAVSLMVISFPNMVTQLGEMFQLPVRIWSHYSSENFPILCYVIGAGFRKYQFKIKKLTCLITIAFCLAISALGDIIYVKMHFNEFGNHVYTNNYYGNLFSILIVFMLFALLYRMDIKTKCVHKIFAFVSGISLEIYLGLVIADKCAYILVEKSEPFIMEHQLSYAAKYIPWILGELGSAMFLAILVKYLREAVKRIFMLRTRGEGGNPFIFFM